MRVVVYCEKCTAIGEAHLHGDWDIKDVMHDCGAVPRMPQDALDRHRKHPHPIRFIFDPPRRVF